MQHKINYYKCLAVDALFEGGRLFMGATSIIYLSQLGISVSQIALLKTIQAIVLVVGEIPTGVFADMMGRKKSLYAAVLSSIIGFLLFYFGKVFWQFAIAECLTAIALCFWSGAYEAYVIESAQLEKASGLMDRYFHTNQSLNSFAVLVFGYIGGLIATSHLSLPYLGAIFCFIILTILLLTLPQEELTPHPHISQQNHWSSLVLHLKMTFNQVSQNHRIIPFLLLLIAIQFLIQPLLHYWQPLMQEQNNLKADQLGIIFSAYSLLNVIVGFIMAKISRYKFAIQLHFTFILLLFFGFFYFGISYFQSSSLSIVLFLLTQSTLTASRTSVSSRMNEQIPAQLRASILSSIGLISRFGMLLALALISILNQYQFKIVQIYFLFGLLAILISLIFIITLKFNKK